MTQAHELVVQGELQLTETINAYVMQGYSVVSRDATSVTMRKPKEFNVIWAVVGFFLCLLPLLVYLVVYAMQQDQVVFIRLAASPGLPQLSPDRRYWWDGTGWQDCTQAAPPGAQRTPDGTMWWDGTEWRRLRPAAEG
jgi:hypothetical protein